MGEGLKPYTDTLPPRQSLTFALKPRLLAWTARVWRESPDRAFPLVSLDARIDSRDIADPGLAEAVKPFATSLQAIKLYLVHADQSPPVAPWATGRFEVAHDRAFMFFYDFLAAPNGPLLLHLLQTAGAETDIVMSVIPSSLGPDRLIFAIADYDFGIHNRLG
jgi:hypothetical protein